MSKQPVTAKTDSSLYKKGQIGQAEKDGCYFVVNINKESLRYDEKTFCELFQPLVNKKEQK